MNDWRQPSGLPSHRIWSALSVDSDDEDGTTDVADDNHVRLQASLFD